MQSTVFLSAWLLVICGRQCGMRCRASARFTADEQVAGALRFARRLAQCSARRCGQRPSRPSVRALDLHFISTSPALIQTHLSSKNSPVQREASFNLRRMRMRRRVRRPVSAESQGLSHELLQRLSHELFPLRRVQFLLAQPHDLGRDLDQLVVSNVAAETAT
jgi:hypothetical protein